MRSHPLHRARSSAPLRFAQLASESFTAGNQSSSSIVTLTIDAIDVDAESRTVGVTVTVTSDGSFFPSLEIEVGTSNVIRTYTLDAFAGSDTRTFTFGNVPDGQHTATITCTNAGDVSQFVSGPVFAATGYTIGDVNGGDGSGGGIGLVLPVAVVAVIAYAYMRSRR